MTTLTRAAPADASLLAEAEAAYRGVLVDARASRDQAAEVVVRARRAGCSEAVVVALRALAWGEHVRLDNARARVLLDQAVRLAERCGLQERLGEVLVSRAAVSHELGRLTAAQHDLDRATDLVGPDAGVEVLVQQAALHHNVGHLLQAARVHRQVLARPDCPPDVLFKTLNNLAIAEVQLGRGAAALDHVERAVVVGEQVGPVAHAIASQSQAWVTMQVGRLADSLQLFERAGELYERAGLPLDEHFVEYADALIGLRLVPEAQDVARRAVAELSKRDALLMAGEAQLRAAHLHLLAGDGVQAELAARAALARLRRQGRTSWVARADVVLGEAEGLRGPVPLPSLRRVQHAATTLERLGLRFDAVEGHLAAGRLALDRRRASEALDSLQRAARLAHGAPVLVRLKGRVAAALAAQEAGDVPAVLRACRAGLDDLAEHQVALPSVELRALASGHGAELGRIGLRAVLPSGSAARVLDWMDRTRAAALVPVDVPTTTGLEDELAGLRSMEAELELAWAGGQEPHDLVARIAAAEHRVRRASWTGSTGRGTDTGRAQSGELRSALAGQSLVVYASLDGVLTAVVLETSGLRLVRLTSTADAVDAAEAMLFGLRRLTRRRSAAATAAARASAEAARTRLVELLVRPLRLEPEVPLVIVPSADLAGVPWSSLHDGPTSLAPSAALWLRTGARRPAGDRVVLVAGPGLPGAVDEVVRLAGVHPGAAVLLPPDCTVAATTSALQGASLAHLSCHGRLRTDNPMFSALGLQDGSLTVHELVAGADAPHRVVLAACESGVGVGYDGNEVLGFVTAMMARGTAGLVASALVVPDLDTVPLMCAMHDEVRRGATLAQALHRARAGLDRSDPGAYVDWCAWNAFGAA